MPPDVILLTAPTGAGKTMACRYFTEMAREEGFSVGGILCRGRYSLAGHKIGIDALDLLTGEEHPLDISKADDDIPFIGRFRLNPLAMEWALQSVYHALDSPLDVVIIDEISPSEVGHGHGFDAALEHLSSARAGRVILPIRSEFQPHLRASLSHLHPATIILTLRNRDLLPDRLLNQVRKAYNDDIEPNALPKQAARYST
ncbi:MAG TPA: DUF2478 domain-containing protein [Chloroflexi bacterium]|jgi:nucleoside-triphosphatase THEP1|nr:DUF2478 domain-containing protein [Chloroflexota bacterium]